MCRHEQEDEKDYVLNVNRYVRMYEQNDINSGTNNVSCLQEL